MIKTLTLLKLSAVIFSVNATERQKFSLFVLAYRVLLSRKINRDILPLLYVSCQSQELHIFTMEADAFNWFSVFFAGCANRWSIQLELIGKLHASQMFLVCVCMCVTVLLVDKFCCCGEPFYVVLKLDVFSSVLSACAGVSAELYKHMVKIVFRACHAGE